PTVQLSAVVTIVMMSSAFLVIPIITPYLVFNLRFPVKDLKWIYMIGGALSFVVLRIIGVLVDRYGSTRLAAVGTAVFLIVSWLSFVRYHARVPITALLVLFLVGMHFPFAPCQPLLI